jgi:uncharacterized HAD superfamily protein/hypoxanthine phosphoribosyltransferase
MAVTYVKYSQLIEDVRLLLTNIPYEIRDRLGMVAGISRSGLIPAAMIAQQLNLPLFGTSRGRFIELVGGQRLSKRMHHFPAIVVDDSVFTGRAMQEAVRFLQVREKVYRAAVYCTPGNQGVVDFFAREIPRPRYFEWNLLHHPDTSTFVLDIDGVLCHDPTVSDNDDDKYREALAHARPLHLPSRHIYGLCTNRLERWRDVTEDWLARHNVFYGELQMSPYLTAAERRQDSAYGTRKGAYYAASAATLFVESCPKQAALIAKVSGKPVICPTHFEAFNA